MDERRAALKTPAWEASAGGRERKNVCRHIWEKRGSTPHHPLSPPRSQYQLNWTNGIGDINCLCNWLKYFDQTTMTLGVACLLKHVFLDLPYTASLLLRRKSRLKEVQSRNKSAHRIIVGHVGALYTSIVVGNLSVPINLQRIFF